MGRGMKHLSVAEIADLAGLAKSRRNFRDEVMRRLRQTLGYDGGWFHTLDPGLPLDSGCWDTLDMTPVERARAGWSGYGPQLMRLRNAMGASRGVALDSEVYSLRQRDRIPFFVDIVRPLAMKHILWAELRLGSQELSVIGLGRADAGRGFNAGVQEFLRQVAPALAMAESLLQLRGAAPTLEMRNGSDPGDDPALTPKEREVLELFEHGASYEDVARMLQISVNTVRDHVRHIYEKLQVTSKVEAVMKLQRARSTP
jgi:DNA-binding CsgD family transcriptional regulator